MTNRFKALMGIKEHLFNIIFPNKCVFCSETISNDTVCCDSCHKNIIKMPYDLCHTCLNSNCICENKPYIRLISVYHYDNYTKNSIFNLKFNGVRKHANFLSSQLLDYLTILSLNDKIDCIIPVPMHKNDKNLRGYNQSEIITHHLASMLNIPYYSDFLIKTKRTKKQHNLDYKARKNNLNNAYSVQNPQILFNNTVLLIDDVYTTGNTVLQCCNTLKLSGIDKIYVATILNANNGSNIA